MRRLERAAKLNRNAALISPRHHQTVGEFHMIRLKQILASNSKDANTHFALGQLYEKTQRKDEAIAEYKTVLGLFPDGSDQAKTQIQKMISNVQNGIANTPENLGAVPTAGK